MLEIHPTAASQQPESRCSGLRSLSGDSDLKKRLKRSRQTAESCRRFGRLSRGDIFIGLRGFAREPICWEPIFKIRFFCV